MNEDDIQIILKQYKSKVNVYKNSSGAYTFEKLAEVLSRGFRKEFEVRNGLGLDHRFDKSDSILIDGDNVSLITKMTLKPHINALRFDEISLFSTILGFSPHGDYKSIGPYDREYYREKTRDLSITDKIHLKCDCIDGSVQNGVRQRFF